MPDPLGLYEELGYKKGSRRGPKKKPKAQRDPVVAGLPGNPSSKPRPAVIGNRTGRKPIRDDEQFNASAIIPDFSANPPDPSIVFVEGRVRIDYWSESMWRNFRRAEELLAKFGLALQLIPAEGTGRVKRRWTRARVDLDVALAEIVDTPGILFDDWTRLWVAGQDIISEEVFDAARKKASAALSRLYNDGKVEKRYDAGGFIKIHPRKPDGTVIDG